MPRTLSPLFTWRSAIAQSDLSGNARHIALTLSLHMSELGDSCFPGYRLLAEETARGQTTISEALKELEEAGFLQVLRKPTRGRNAVNHYRAMLPDRSIKKSAPEEEQEADIDEEMLLSDPVNAPEVGAESDKTTTVRTLANARVLEDVNARDFQRNGDGDPTPASVTDLSEPSQTPPSARPDPGLAAPPCSWSVPPYRTGLTVDQLRECGCPGCERDASQLEQLAVPRFEPARHDG